MASQNQRIENGPVQETLPPVEPCTLVIFGGSGDLAPRRLIPALYNLLLDGLLPSNYVVLGLGRTPMSDEEFRATVRDGVVKHSRQALGELAWITEQRANSINYTLPWPDFIDIRAEQRAFSNMSATTAGQFNLRVEGGQQVANGEFVSGSYFQTLRPILTAGRPIADVDERAAAGVAVISPRLWKDLRPGAESFSPFEGLDVELLGDVFANLDEGLTALPAGAALGFVPLLDARQVFG